MPEDTDTAPRPERFWYGPIQSRRHAEKIIGRSGWTFVVLAGLFAIPMAQQFSEPKAGLVLVIAAPAVALLWIKDAVPAAILLALCAFGMAGGAMTLLRDAPVGEARATGRLLPFLLWCVLAYVAWRAFVAARRLKALQGPRS